MRGHKRADRLSVGQTFAGQDHDGAVHPMHDVIGNHLAARGAVIDEDARLRGFEAQHCLLTGTDERQPSTAQCARGCVEIDIVLHQVFRRVLERQLDVVVLMADDQRTGNRTVECTGPDFGASVIDSPTHLFSGHCDFDHLRPAGCDLIVFWNERRGDKIKLEARKSGDVPFGHRRLGNHH